MRLLIAGLVCGALLLGATVDDAHGLVAWTGSATGEREVHVTEALGRESATGALEVEPEQASAAMQRSSLGPTRPAVLAMPVLGGPQGVAPAHLPPDRGPPGP